MEYQERRKNRERFWQSLFNKYGKHVEPDDSAPSLEELVEDIREHVKIHGAPDPLEMEIDDMMYGDDKTEETINEMDEIIFNAVNMKDINEISALKDWLARWNKILDEKKI